MDCKEPMVSNLNRVIHLSGLKSPDYPKDVNEQSGKAVSLVREIIQKVLGRD